MSEVGQSVFDLMRAALLPNGSAPLVRLFMRDASYFDVTYVQRLVDVAQSRVGVAAMGLDELNDLERLGLQVLMDSAYLEFPARPTADATHVK